jgi:hypothetical protein
MSSRHSMALAHPSCPTLTSGMSALCLETFTCIFRAGGTAWGLIHPNVPDLPRHGHNSRLASR